ncbi:nuclear transport factor 2 family protein [Streptomyces sp. NPDC050145]|uniref:nuclear transport factor 2 family protein n=1 Tax=Streptomyces sp. NPDC050145 TaxID=3365602 RepID=UPI00379260C0
MLTVTRSSHALTTDEAEKSVSILADLTTAVRLPAVESAVLHAEVQQFYTRQMQLLDLHRIEEWGESFTEDATFALPILPEPVRGRADLVSSTRRNNAQLVEAKEQHRHVVSMLDVRPQQDATVQVRSYVAVYATTLGEPSRLHRMCVCEDILVRDADGRLQVRARLVTRDDLA